MNADIWAKKLEGLKQFGRIRSVPWVSVEEIDRYEEKNGYRLPELYREWLQMSDGGEFFPPASLQLFGVQHKPLICLPEEDSLKGEYMMVGTMPYGDPVLFKKGGEEFLLYNQEAGRIEPEEVFGDFSSFLDHLPTLLGLED